MAIDPKVVAKTLVKLRQELDNLEDQIEGIVTLRTGLFEIEGQVEALERLALEGRPKQKSAHAGCLHLVTPPDES